MTHSPVRTPCTKPDWISVLDFSYLKQHQESGWKFVFYGIQLGWHVLLLMTLEATASTILKLRNSSGLRENTREL